MAKPLIVKEAGKTKTVFQCVIVGAGANGSHFFRSLLHTVRTHWDKFLAKGDDPDFDVLITIVDKDVYEPKNKGNQLCDDEDMYVPKVIALAERYGEHYRVPVNRVVEYVKDLEMLHKLFPDYSNGYGKHVQIVKVLVGMVDNNKSRQLFHRFFMSDEVKDLIYLDAGVEGVTVLNKPEDKFTAEDWEMVNSSGFGGQVVCGYKMAGKVLLSPVGLVYPNILEDAHSAFPDESCAALIINNPQRLKTNQLAAELTNVFMNNLFHMGSIFQHYVNFNAQFGGSRPVFISDEVIERAEQIKKEPVAL